MTAKAIVERGPAFRKEHGGPEKRSVLNAMTLERYELLEAVLEARRINLRTANRRWRRRNGRGFQNA